MSPGAALAAAALLAGTASAHGQAQDGRALFVGGTQPACSLCHTLKVAGADGTVGPSLDELKPDADRVAAALRRGVGVMPSFAGQLSEAQIELLARYVATGAGREPPAAP